MLRIETLCLGLTTSLLALGCGDDSPPQRGDSGQSATASDGGGADIDSGKPPAPTVDGASRDSATAVDAASTGDAAQGLANLSCEQLTQATSTALRGALDPSSSCTLDTDCKKVALSTDCYDGCSGIVSATVAERLASAIGQQNGSTCVAFKERGCKVTIPPCVPTRDPVCIAGECREHRGSLPVARPDGGASVAAVVLDNPASPAQVEVSAGQRLELTLRSVGPGAYTEPTVSAVALRFVESFLPRLQNPGGPTKVFVFEAVTPGTVQVSVPHSTRPDAFSLTVTIR